ncbi:MAG TPA: FAD-binding protein, partial [Candidatus Poseidoniales archaeon]|nr:FAD-binding protein [Candidatus Poseidoniales archaeon]
AHYIDDPYIETPIEREPLSDEIDIVIIGGGFGGLLAGARLREAGIENIRMIEKAADFGGTWYWNRYPGAACDIESYVYLPLLEELDYMPSEKYVHAKEILAHSRAIGRHYDLYEGALFQTEVRVPSPPSMITRSRSAKSSLLTVSRALNVIAVPLSRTSSSSDFRTVSSDLSCTSSKFFL